MSDRVADRTELSEARHARDLARAEWENARGALEAAKRRVEVAQKQLNEADKVATRLELQAGEI